MKNYVIDDYGVTPLDDICNECGREAWIQIYDLSEDETDGDPDQVIIATCYHCHKQWNAVSGQVIHDEYLYFDEEFTHEPEAWWLRLFRWKTGVMRCADPSAWPVKLSFIRRFFRGLLRACGVTQVPTPPAPPNAGQKKTDGTQETHE